MLRLGKRASSCEKQLLLKGLESGPLVLPFEKLEATTPSMFGNSRLRHPACRATTTGKIRRQLNMTARRTTVSLAWILIFGSLSFGCDAGWVDPDTPIEHQTTEAKTHTDSRQYEIVRAPFLLQFDA